MINVSLSVATWKGLWVFAFLQLTVVQAGLPGSTTAASVTAHGVSTDSRVACALRFTRLQLSDTSQITILGSAPWLGDFLAATRVPVTLLQVGAERLPVHNLMSDVVFVVTNDEGNGTFVKEALTQVRRSEIFYERIVIWWRAGDAQVAIDAAWDLDTVRPVVVSGSGDKQSVFRYHIGCEQGSVVARAVLAGDCSQITLLQFSGDIFPNLLQWDLHGCPLRLASRHTKRNKKTGEIFLAKMVAPVAWAFAKRVRATLDLRDRPFIEDFGDVFPNGTAWGILGSLFQDHMDLLVEVTFRNSTRDRIADLGPSFITTCVHFFVPSGMGADLSPFDMLRREFSSTVLALVGLAFTAIISVLAFSLWGVSEGPVEDAALFALSALLGQFFSLPGATNKIRILTAGWMLFSIVISTAYQAVLHSLQAATREETEINSLPLLVQSGLVVEAFPGTIKELKQDAREQGDTTLLALCERFKKIRQLTASVTRMAHKKDIAMYFERNSVLHIAHRVEAVQRRKLVHQVAGHHASCRQITYFILRRGSRFSPVITQVVTQALDFGFIKLMDDQWARGLPEDTQGWSSLTFTKVSGTFYLLGTGLGASSMVLGLEIMGYKLQRI